MKIGVVLPQTEIGNDPAADWGKELEAWHAMRGISHLCVHTGGMGLKTPADHVQTLRRFRETVGLE